MDRQAKLERIREHNPFISASTADPWNDTSPDVGRINGEVFSDMMVLIRSKKQAPDTGVACIVLGEAGSGKTHLISRVKRTLTKKDKDALFAYIQPIEDPSQTYRYLLREIVVNLCRSEPEKSGYTQFDRLLGHILTDLLIKKVRIKQISTEKQRSLIKALKTDPTYFRRSDLLRKVLRHQSIENYGKDYLLTEFPHLDEQFLSVLLKYRLDNLRTKALSWLKGAVLDDQESHALKVNSRFGMSEETLEQEARSLLIGLGQIIAKYRGILVICFDRLENLVADKQMIAFGRMVEFLVDQTPAMLPLAFFRGQLWEESFEHRLNDHVVTRLNSNKFVLSGCDTIAAFDIIKARLSSHFQADIGDDVFPFTWEGLQAAFGSEILSPREVIIEANNLLRQTLGSQMAEDKPLVNDALFEEFSREYDRLISDPELAEPDRYRLRHTLDLYLNSFSDDSDIKLHSVAFRGNHKDAIDFVCRFETSRNGSCVIAFVIDVTTHHKTVNSKLETAIAFLEENPSHRVIYIREQRTAFPGPDRWKVTNQTLERFRDLGGITCFLTRQQAMAWYAMTFLDYKRKSDVPNANRVKPERISSNKREFAAFAAWFFHNSSNRNLFHLDALICLPRVNKAKQKRMRKLSALNLK